MNNKFRESEFQVKNLKKGDFIVFKDNASEVDFFECPIFNLVDIVDDKTVILKDLSSRVSRKLVTFEASKVRSVNITPLELFRNYIINTGLNADDGLIVNGETIYAIKMFDLINSSSDIIDLITKLKESDNYKLFNRDFTYIDELSLGFSGQYFDEAFNIEFNGFKKACIEAISSLSNSSENELINLYISDQVYKFSEFTIEDSNFLNSSINDARNAKLI